MKLLAIDAGASGGKAILGEFTDKLHLTEVRRFPNAMIEVDNRRRWDVDALFKEVVECIAAVPDADSVGISTWGVDYGYIGPDGTLLDKSFAYRDSRTEETVPIVHGKISFEKLYSITGIQHMPINTIYQVADDLESRPDLVESADKLLMMPELLGYMLTGVPVAEYTNASTSGMLDAATRQWSGEILDAIGFPSGLLAEISQPGEIKVHLKKEIAKQTGSKAGFIFTACHDTASAVAAIPLDRADSAYISSGTWSLIGQEIDGPILTDEARDANLTNEGGVGGKIRFLKNVTGLWIIQELQRVWKNDGYDYSFDRICELASEAPAFQALLNPDDPSFVSPDDMSMAIAEYRTLNGQPIPEGMGGVARCVFESLAVAYRRIILELENVTGRRVQELNVVGGGCNNPLLCKLTANACEVPLVAGPAEASAIGNILVQAISHGIVKDIEEGRRLIAESVKPVKYTPDSDDRWIESAKRFEKLV